MATLPTCYLSKDYALNHQSRRQSQICRSGFCLSQIKCKGPPTDHEICEQIQSHQHQGPMRLRRYCQRVTGIAGTRLSNEALLPFRPPLVSLPSPPYSSGGACFRRPMCVREKSVIVMQRQSNETSRQTDYRQVNCLVPVQNQWLWPLPPVLILNQGS